MAICLGKDIIDHFLVPVKIFSRIGVNVLIYENVRRLCQERNITVADLERKLGFGNGTIGKWKHRSSSPGIDKVGAIARFFSVTVDSLLADPDAKSAT